MEKILIADNIPGVCDNPVILNLHLLLWDSYIAYADVEPPFAVEGRCMRCGYPPSFARSQNTGNGTLGYKKAETETDSVFFMS